MTASPSPRCRAVDGGACLFAYLTKSGSSVRDRWRGDCRSRSRLHLSPQRRGQRSRQAVKSGDGDDGEVVEALWTAGTCHSSTCLPRISLPRPSGLGWATFSVAHRMRMRQAQRRARILLAGGQCRCIAIILPRKGRTSVIELRRRH